MASFFRGLTYPTTAISGLLWTLLLCIYSVLICPYIAGMPGPTLFCLYASGIITALYIQPAATKAIADREVQYPTAVKISLQLFVWIALGAGLALFNYLAFDFPYGSGDKVIIGFAFLGIYNAISCLLKQPQTPLKPKQLQLYRHSLIGGLIALPVIIAGITVWIITTQLSVYWPSYPLSARSPEQIILTSALFMLLVMILISQNLLQLGFKVLNTQAQQLLSNIDKRSYQLNPRHICEFECIRQPRVQILNNPAYQQKIIHRLRALKYQDLITGTHNARFIKDFLHNRWQKEPSLQLPFLLIQIKEPYSEKALDCQYNSDSVQSEVAQRIHQFLMPEDILARLDNNRFAVIPANLDLLDERNITQLLNRNLVREPLAQDNRSDSIQCEVSKQNFLTASTSSGSGYAIQG